MKKIIVRIAEGLGNQLFMYSHAYSLSKKLGYELQIDNTSGYFKTKNRLRNYELDKFNISTPTCDDNDKFDTYPKDFKRKLLKMLDLIKTNKCFYLEKKNNDKSTAYFDFSNYQFSNKLFTEGYFQTEKYFIDYSKDLKKELLIKSDYLDNNNKYIDLLKKDNSVSICIRQNRYSEGKIKDNNKSNQFTQNTINYIERSVSFFKKKIDKPVFFIWSNDFKHLRNYFNEKDFIFIENEKNKSLNDFNLLMHAKHFIVGPTPFHWWGAWLNQNKNKICLRPNDINPSNNIDFWPKSWISI